MAQPQIAPRTLWNSEEQGAFVTALLHDGRGDLWVATEDKGVWHRQDKRWQNFTTPDIGDDTVTSLAADRKGRVWAGTLKSGFAVWNGEGWKRYTPLESGIGEHIFDIASCPLDGAMWVAHSAGLSRIEESGAWTTWPRTASRPADAINALAFDAKGNLVAGTQAEGIATAQRDGDYQIWKVTPAANELPITATGVGLPSNLINDVLVAGDGRIYAATARGVAWSEDSETWHFVRGSDWTEKHTRREGAPPLPEGAVAQTLLAEDQAMALAETEGEIWVGFRRKGYAVIDVAQNQVAYAGGDGAPGVDFVTSIVIDNHEAIIGTYGGGIVQSLHQFVEKKTRGTVEIDRTFPPLPPVATVAELEAMREKIATAPELPWGHALSLPDDWATQGNWVGRYGANYIKLCGTSWSDEWASHHKYGSRVLAGGGASVYSYTQWLQSDLRRVLFFPQTGGRRQSELNDGSWQADEFPAAMTGPDLWVRFDVPTGIHRASFYFFNKDGHSGSNRWRDYELEMKPWRETLKEAEAAPTLARGRVQNFWGGVYKNFAVVGPGSYYLKIGRNHSHVTMIQCVFLDRWNGRTPTDEKTANEWLKGIEPKLVAATALAEDANPTLSVAVNLWAALDANIVRGDALTNRAARLAAYRAAAATGAAPELLAAWRRTLGAWNAEDDAEFNAWQKQAQATRAAQEK